MKSSLICEPKHLREGEGEGLTAGIWVGSDLLLRGAWVQIEATSRRGPRLCVTRLVLHPHFLAIM